MAALNTLRTKGGVVLAVVIGISLLAFLLGDLTSSSGTLFNSSSMNVGVIDGEKVSIQEYSGEIDKLTLVQQMLTGRESLNEQETEAIRSQTWDKIIRARAFSKSIENLGLIVSDDEQIDMANGEYISPVLASIFVDQQTGGYDREMVRGFVTNIEADQTGRSATFWSYIENEMQNERALAKYFSLIKNGIYVTNAEAEDITKISNKDYNIEFVSKPTYMIADSLVTVKESEIKAYYDAHKSQFKQVASRDIEYVVFESLPSPKDYEDASKKIAEIATDFATTDDIKQFVNLNSTNGFDPSFKKAEEMTPAMAAYAFGSKRDSIYGPSLEGDIYTLARVVEIKTLPDTLGAKHILIANDNPTLADSLVSVLKADKSKFAELASQFSQDRNANLSGGDLGTFAMNQMIPEFSSAIASAKVGEIIKVATPYGLHVVEVTKIGNLFPKAQMAVINYTVDPSSQTSQEVFAKATEFASKASAKDADFDKVASEVGTAKRVARLRAGDRNIQGIEGSTEIVRWVFDNKQGSISSVISVGEQNIIAKVVSANEHGIAPLDKVVREVTELVRNEQKAAYISEQIKGMTSLEQMAEKLGVQVGKADSIDFKSFYIPEIGVAPKVIGAMTAIAQGTISAPIESMGSVSVIKVTGSTPTENTTIESEKVILKTSAENSIQQRVMGAVYTLADVEDMRIKFF